MKGREKERQGIERSERETTTKERNDDEKEKREAREREKGTKARIAGREKLLLSFFSKRRKETAEKKEGTKLTSLSAKRKASRKRSRESEK